MNRWTRLGIEAYRAGNRQQAQRFFRFALMEKPDDVRTLLWMVEVAETDAEKERCLQQVIEIEPNQTLARRALVDVQRRLQATHLPHVNPFSTEISEADHKSAEPASLNVRSTPPFMEALAEQEDQAESPPLQKNPTRTFLEKNWLILGVIILGVFVIIGLIWLIVGGL